MNNPRFLLPFEQGLLDMPDSKVLVVRPVDSFGLNAFPNDLLLEQGFKTTHDSLVQSGYAVTTRADGRFRLAVVNLTRSKAESLGNIARAKRITDGPVLVNGVKTDGIESILRQVKKHVNVQGVISKSHGKVFWFETAGFPEWEEAAKLQQNSAGYFTEPGMFSFEKIDEGSQRLVPYLTDLKGRGADLGAGWGWLSKQALESSAVTALDLLEADFAALEAARQNITDPRADYYWQDVTVLAKPNEAYDFVVSNPPFHQSRKAEPELGKSFIGAAASLLKPSGRFLMVANRQLPYESALEQNFKHWNTLSEDGKFKVFEATRPKK